MITENSIVTTVDGSKELRKNCRYILGKYYRINDQCIFLNSKWYRCNSPKVFLDYHDKNYKLFSEHTPIEGIVEKHKIGYFTPCLYKNVEVVTDLGTKDCLNEELAKEKYILAKRDGKWYNKTIYENNKEILDVKSNSSVNYRIQKDYGSELHMNSFIESTQEYETLNPDEFTIKNDDIADLLRELTWGVEFETDGGGVPINELGKVGLIPLRDGSIRGDEFATIPLSGESGLSRLKKSCELLQEYCRLDLRGSLHLHIGGLPTDPQHAYAIYILLLTLEQDLYSMFPKYYNNTSSFKRRDYCSPLPKIGVNLKMSLEEKFNYLFKNLSGGLDYRGKVFPTNHPADTSNRHKWYINSRYTFVNLISFIFNPKRTIEFRIHSPSFNKTKVFNWLYICSAIVNYVKDNYEDLCKATPRSLPKVELKQVITTVYKNHKKLAAYLCSYVDERKCIMKKDSEVGDSIGATDVERDWDYEFVVDNYSLIDEI